MNDLGVNLKPDISSSSSNYSSPSSQQQNHQAGASSDRAPNDQVRSRWTPKPEQILILESIFNSGMVNPPKDETVRIRKLLEKFGPVGDANVFYWFQNRRSRSRRRQRQIQANIEANARNAHNSIQYNHSSNNLNSPRSNDMIIPLASGFNCSGVVASGGATLPPFLIPSSSEALGGSLSNSSSSSSMGGGGFGGGGGIEGFFSGVGFHEIESNNNGSLQAMPPLLCSADVTSELQYHHQPAGAVAAGGGGVEAGGFVTVFLNGVPTEVPRGPLDMKAMCGQDFMLVHCSGHPVPVNEYGFSIHTLQHGESYFLVAKSL